MLRKKAEIFCIGLLVAVFVRYGAAHAFVPTERMRESVEEIRSIVTDPKFQGDAQKEKRRARIRKILTERFDFTEMAKRSLGFHWRHHPDRQQEFVKVFVDYLEKNYISEIESFEDELITYKKEEVDGEYAVVYSSVTFPKNGEEFSLDYKLHLKGGEWMVYDVILGNISAVNNYRSQFNRIISKDGFDGLLKLLRDKGK